MFTGITVEMARVASLATGVIFKRQILNLYHRTSCLYRDEVTTLSEEITAVQSEDFT